MPPLPSLPLRPLCPFSLCEMHPGPLLPRPVPTAIYPGALRSHTACLSQNPPHTMHPSPRYKAGRPQPSPAITPALRRKAASGPPTPGQCLGSSALTRRGTSGRLPARRPRFCPEERSTALAPPTATALELPYESRSVASPPMPDLYLARPLLTPRDACAKAIPLPWGKTPSRQGRW